MGHATSKPWFAQKRFGIGCGLPVAWQGWVVLITYIVVCVAAPVGLAMIVHDPSVLVRMTGIAEFTATVVLFVVCAARTQGGWRWRWGGKP